MPQHVTIFIARGVTDFPDDESFHAEELTPPVQHPDAQLIKVAIEGNRVTHWWQATEFKVNGPTLRAAAAHSAAPTP